AAPLNHDVARALAVGANSLFGLVELIEQGLTVGARFEPDEQLAGHMRRRPRVLCQCALDRYDHQRGDDGAKEPPEHMLHDPSSRAETRLPRVERLCNNQAKVGTAIRNFLAA